MEDRTTRYLAKTHGLRLDRVDDAFAAIGSGLAGCVYTMDDLSVELFDLGNGVLGEILQKFVNYRFRAAIVLPEEHSFGLRVTELAREHRNHPAVRMVTNLDEAIDWLESEGC